MKTLGLIKEPSSSSIKSIKTVQLEPKMHNTDPCFNPLRVVPGISHSVYTWDVESYILC